MVFLAQMQFSKSAALVPVTSEEVLGIASEETVERRAVHFVLDVHKVTIVLPAGLQ